LPGEEPPETLELLETIREESLFLHTELPGPAQLSEVSFVSGNGLMEAGVKGGY
jgi:hypothetical protein